MAMTRSNGTRSKRHRIPIADNDIGIYMVWELMLNCCAGPGVVGTAFSAYVAPLIQKNHIAR